MMQPITLAAGPLALAGLTNQTHASAAPVILALHGYLDNAASMLPLAAYFSDFHFVAVDLAGHGKSEHRPLGSAYNLLDYVQDIDAMVETQGWSDIILLGHSLGGIIASIYAAVSPHRVKAVVSIDACGPVTASDDSSLEQLRAGIASRRHRARRSPPTADLTSAVAARCRVADISAAHAELILARNIAQNTAGEQVWRSDPRVRTTSLLRLTEQQAESMMRGIACPIAFIAASDSFKKLPQTFSQREHWFKAPSYFVFKGGHHIHLEQTEAVGRKIRQFVDQL